jgi:hypothetical protein
MSRIRLIASSDDFLLEERLTAAVAELAVELGGVEPEPLDAEATPEAVATELVSRSLFATERLLVVGDVRSWLDAPAPPGTKTDREEPPDLRPLLQVLAEGPPEGVALVLGAWCGRKPTGELVTAVEAAGTFEWVALPPPPKPWEDAALSREQRAVLEQVLRRAAGVVVFDRAATSLLLDRLGFAPRLLVQEVRKLAGAAGAQTVDEALVRRLTFPRERSVEVVRDAVLGRRIEPLLDLIAAAEAGEPVNDWQGQRLDIDALGAILIGTIGNLLLQMLYLRRLVAATPAEAELAPKRTSRDGWYNRRFKSDLGPVLTARLNDDAPSPLARPGGKPPSVFSLGAVFAGAGRYADDELAAAIAHLTRVEHGLRQEGVRLAALTVWLTDLIGGGPDRAGDQR